MHPIERHEVDEDLFGDGYLNKIVIKRFVNRTVGVRVNQEEENIIPNWKLIGIYLNIRFYAKKQFSSPSLFVFISQISPVTLSFTMLHDVAVTGKAFPSLSSLV